MNEAAIRAQIWATSRESTEVVESAKKGISLQPGSMPYYEALLRRVEELMKPRKARKPKTDPTTDESRRRYREAKWQYELQKYPEWVKGNFSGSFFLEPDYPNCGETNGLTEFIINFLTWSGHFSNRTSNEGRVIIKDGEPKRIPSSSKNGMQDIDNNLKHPDHEFGIPWKIEVKAGKDIHADHQKEYGKIVQRTGGVYSAVRSAEDLLQQYDQLMVRKVRQKELF